MDHDALHDVVRDDDHGSRVREDQNMSRIRDDHNMSRVPYDVQHCGHHIFNVEPHSRYWNYCACDNHHYCACDNHNCCTIHSPVNHSNLRIIKDIRNHYHGDCSSLNLNDGSRGLHTTNGNRLCHHFMYDSISKSHWLNVSTRGAHSRHATDHLGSYTNGNHYTRYSRCTNYYDAQLYNGHRCMKIRCCDLSCDRVREDRNARGHRRKDRDV